MFTGNKNESRTLLVVMTPYSLTLILLFAFPFMSSFGQSAPPTSVTISGGPCLGGSPLAVSSPVPATSITWMLNGTAVASQTATQANISLVAGAHGAGSNANQFYNPDRLFVDAYGNMYIPDLGNNRVQKWASGATTGVTVAGGNGAGNGANQLNQPTGVTLDPQGNIYVADQENNRIQKWAPGAAAGTTVAGLGNELVFPTDIFMDAQGSLYVSSQGTNTVIKYTPDFSQWTVVAGQSASGDGLDQFDAPTGIFVDAAGNVYVCDTNNDRVMKWAPGASAGIVVAGGNGHGRNPDQLANPLDVGVDCQGNMYIADYTNMRVQLWKAGAASGTTIVNGTYLMAPIGIYLDGNNSVYIADNSESYVVLYDLAIERTYTPTSPGAWSAMVNTGCGILTSNAITISNSMSPDLPADTVLCSANLQLRLNAHSGYLTYLWQDGSTDSTFTVTGPGAYSVQVTSLCGGPYTDKITVSVDKPPVGFLPADTTICSYDPLLLKPSADFTTYQWSDGSAGATTLVNQPGIYWLEGTDEHGCTVTDSVLVNSKACTPEGVYVPSAFTPNGDGKNDLFRPEVFGTVSNYHFAVYDRYGQLVFSSKEPGAGWDGKVGSAKQESNVFVWYCSFQLAGQPQQMEKGTVMLIR
jgi:gliding motility-associated-like protein